MAAGMVLGLSLSACAAPAEPVLTATGTAPATAGSAAAPATAGPAASAPTRSTGPAPASGWTLIAAALADGGSAELEAQGLVDQGLPGVVRIYDTADGRRIYRVAIGSFATRAEAEQYAGEVRSRYGMTQVWVTHY